MNHCQALDLIFIIVQADIYTGNNKGGGIASMLIASMVFTPDGSLFFSEKILAI
jgi:hypothetical protein